MERAPLNASPAHATVLTADQSWASRAGVEMVTRTIVPIHIVPAVALSGPYFFTRGAAPTV